MQNVRKLMKTGLLLGGITGTVIALKKRTDVLNMIDDIGLKLQRNEKHQLHKLKS